MQQSCPCFFICVQLLKISVKLQREIRTGAISEPHNKLKLVIQSVFHIISTSTFKFFSCIFLMSFCHAGVHSFDCISSACFTGSVLESPIHLLVVQKIVISFFHSEICIQVKVYLFAGFMISVSFLCSLLNTIHDTQYNNLRLNMVLDRSHLRALSSL